jgi:hypothetical protein
MALCLDCKADYLRHITICPACGKALEPDPAPPTPEESHDFVELMGAGYAEGMAAAATLEAAGLETQISTTGFNIYMPAPLNVVILVRERDLDAARAALRLPR